MMRSDTPPPPAAMPAVVENDPRCFRGTSRVAAARRRADDGVGLVDGSSSTRAAAAAAEEEAQRAARGSMRTRPSGGTGARGGNRGSYQSSFKPAYK